MELTNYPTTLLKYKLSYLIGVLAISLLTSSGVMLSQQLFAIVNKLSKLYTMPSWFAMRLFSIHRNISIKVKSELFARYLNLSIPRALCAAIESGPL